MERAAKANEKAMALLLKSASPTLSNYRIQGEKDRFTETQSRKIPAALPGSAVRRRISIPTRDTSEMFELVENRLYAYTDDSTLLAVVL